MRYSGSGRRFDPVLCSATQRILIGHFPSLRDYVLLNVSKFRLDISAIATTNLQWLLSENREKTEVNQSSQYKTSSWKDIRTYSARHCPYGYSSSWATNGPIRHKHDVLQNRVLQPFLTPITPDVPISSSCLWIKYKPDFDLNNETLDVGSDKECLWLNFHAESFFFTGAMTTNLFKTTAQARR